MTGADRESGDPSYKADRRSALAPPYVGGLPALPTGGGSYSSPTSQGAKGGTSTGTNPAQPGTAGEKIRVDKATSADEDDDDDNEKKGKASRRGGIDP